MAFFGQISALIAALLWSVSSFVFTDATKRIGMVQLNISRMILACVLLLITFPFLNINYDLSFWQITLLTISGFIGLVIGDSALFKSFAEIGPRISMLIMSLNPAIAAIIAYFVLGESLSIWGILGIYKFASTSIYQHSQCNLVPNSYQHSAHFIPTHTRSFPMYTPHHRILKVIQHHLFNISTE